MGKIATEQEAISVGQLDRTTPQPSRGCTKSRAEEFGCIVDGSYENNQLVQLNDLRPKYIYCNLYIEMDTSNDVLFNSLDCAFDWINYGDYVEEVDTPPYTDYSYINFAVTNGGKLGLRGITIHSAKRF